MCKTSVDALIFCGFCTKDCFEFETFIRFFEIYRISIPSPVYLYCYNPFFGKGKEKKKSADLIGADFAIKRFFRYTISVDY